MHGRVNSISMKILRRLKDGNQREVQDFEVFEEGSSHSRIICLNIGLYLEKQEDVILETGDKLVIFQ